MKYLRICIITWLGFFWGLTEAQEFRSLNLLTETYPPYNYYENHILRGISVDLLIAASKKADLGIMRADIKLRPWARGYKRALEGPQVLLFSTTRTPTREDLFKWAGPIAKTHIVLLAKKSRGLTIRNPTDLYNLKIGTIRDDVGEQLSLAAGVLESQLSRASSAESLAQMLRIGRIDVWAYEENTSRWFLKSIGESNDSYEVVYTLKEGEIYYAFSLDVPDFLVEQLQRGIDAVKSSPGQIGQTLYDDILSHYL